MTPLKTWQYCDGDVHIKAKLTEHLEGNSVFKFQDWRTTPQLYVYGVQSNTAVYAERYNTTLLNGQYSGIFAQSKDCGAKETAVGSEWLWNKIHF
jgi:hypothetical protein